ncbi:SRPBCC domain-containing protein [Acetobacter farinalis]|nr:SRPBCC domain-containing protein [Acetobacter farinalis]
MHEKSATLLIKAPRAAVWEALTSPPIIERYFFGTVLKTDWRVASPMLFSGTYQGRTYEDHGTVLTFAPPTSLSYSYWSSFSETEDRPDTRLIVGYFLEDDGESTHLTVTTSNCATEEQAQHSVETWQVVLNGLKALLETTPQPPA